ncbi:MAG: hypothetical protein ACRDL8_01595 [Solirubrobacteraceae bacterium]
MHFQFLCYRTPEILAAVDRPRVVESDRLVRVSMKPLRDVANRRRSDRPRYQPGEMAPALPVVRR